MWILIKILCDYALMGYQAQYWSGLLQKGIYALGTITLLDLISDWLF